jgi:hypothetical protein
MEIHPGAAKRPGPLSMENDMPERRAQHSGHANAQFQMSNEVKMPNGKEIRQ